VDTSPATLVSENRNMEQDGSDNETTGLTAEELMREAATLRSQIAKMKKKSHKKKQPTVPGTPGLSIQHSNGSIGKAGKRVYAKKKGKSEVNQAPPINSTALKELKHMRKMLIASWMSNQVRGKTADELIPRKPKREKKPHTAKQIAAHGNFKNTVAIAKQFRSKDENLGWHLAMSKAFDYQRSQRGRVDKAASVPL